MKNHDKRLMALERTTQRGTTRDLSSTLSAIEDMCSERRIPEAALIVLDHLVRQVEKHKIIFDDSGAVVERFLSQDPVVNGLSSSADAQLVEYWRAHDFADLRREVGVERFDRVKTWKLLPPPSPPDPELGRLHRANKQPNL